jgi:hypothetical protein
MKKLSISFLFTLIFLSSSFSQNNTNPNTLDQYTALLTEEKLAHDTYQSFYNLYEKNIFQNILGAELRHFDMMAEVVNIHSESKKEFNIGNLGEFEDPGFQKMFDELYEKGKESLRAALEVGALIEETDIKDLKLVVLNEKDETTIEILNRLISASENHLRAFVSNLSKSGNDYQPVILDKNEFDQILASKSSCCSSSKGENAEACCSAKEKGNKACSSEGKNKGKAKGKCCVGS